jgi:hypothetical protein
MMLHSSPFSHLAGQAAKLAGKPVTAETRSEPSISDTAAAIVLAGRKRRGEIFIDAAPPQPAGVTCTAAQIIAAGKRARGEF